MTVPIPTLWLELGLVALVALVLVIIGYVAATLALERREDRAYDDGKAHGEAATRAWLAQLHPAPAGRLAELTAAITRAQNPAQTTTVTIALAGRHARHWPPEQEESHWPLHPRPIELEAPGETTFVGALRAVPLDKVADVFEGYRP